MQMVHETYLRKTLELANFAVSNGNHPFGALLVLDDVVILEALNTVNTDHDVTKHAELNLASLASQKYLSTDLNRAVLYTSTEPCAMCSGALIWAGIRRIVYACSASTLGEIAGATFVMSCREVYSKLKENFEIEGPMLEKEASMIHLEYWKRQ